MTKTKKNQIFRIKVAEAKPRDVGKSRIRMHADFLNALSVNPGEVVELVGKKKTSGFAWPFDSEEQKINVVRIDGQTRKNAGVSINEYVTIRKVDFKTCRSITLVPVDGKLEADGDFCEFVKNRLQGIPLVEDNDMSVGVLFTTVTATVNTFSNVPPFPSSVCTRIE